MHSKCRSLYSSRLTAILLIVTLLSAGMAFAGDPDEKDADRDHPIEREQWFLHGRSVKGRPATELLERAQQQRDKLRMQNLLRRQVRTAVTAAASAATPVWTELGPSPMRSVVTAGDDQDYGFVTGRATAVVVDQNDPTGNTVYLGGAYGGVWKSTTAANSDTSKVFWTPIIDDQPTTAVGAIAIQPGNSNLLLVGTGEANSSTDSYYGLGILRSTDGGNSWTLISSANNGLRPFHGLAFSKIAFSTDDPNIVVAATAAASEGITVGAEQPANSAASCANSSATATCRGIYYSYDSGQTWSQVTMVDPSGAPDNGSSSSVVYNPQEHKFYAASRAHGIYVSSDAITWQRMGSDSFGFSQPSSTLSVTNCPTSPTNLTTCPLYRAEIAIVPGRDEMYVWFVNSADPPVNGGIFQTKDGGKTWTALNVNGINNCGDSLGCGTQQGDYNLALAAVPNGSTATDIYAGAINIFRCQVNSSNPTCTAQPFVNLTHVYGCSPSGSFSHVHPDQHAFDFLESNPNIIYFANDGGIYRTLSSLSANNVPASCPASPPNQPFYPFDNLNGTMGSMTQFVWFAQHPTNQYTMLGGTQDNGSPAVDSTNSGTNGLTWRSVLRGDGGFTDINPNNPNEWFSENTRVTLQRCANGISCTPGQFTPIVSSGTVGGDSAAFYMPFLLDPQDSTKIILGTCRVWRTSTTGLKVSQLGKKFDTTSDSVPCATGQSPMVSALAAGGPVTASGSQVIYAGTDDGRVFFTNSALNTATTWTNISAQGGFSNSKGYPISGIALDQRDATGNTAYVTVMGFNTSHVWQTTNGGSTWTDITGNLPDSPADAVVVNKADGTIYVGTDVGVFSTSTAAGSATQWTEVGPATGAGALPNVAVTRLAIFAPAGQPARLRVSTYGRGIWEMPLASANTPDYALTISNPDLLTYPGQSVSFNGTLTAFSGYNNSVALTCDVGVGGPLPSPCTPNISSPVPSAAGTAFTITAGNSAVQDFSFKIKGVGSDANTLMRQQAVSLRVIDFSVGTPQPSSITNLTHGDSTTIQLTATSLGSFDQQVRFGCNGFTLPTGWSCSSTQATLTPGGTAQAVITLKTSASTPPGTYNVDVDGHWDFNGLVRVHSQPVPVTVVANPGIILGSPSFTPNIVKVTQALSATITITPHDGYTGTMTLSCTGATSAGIAPTACSFNPPTVTVTDANAVTSTLTVNTNSGIAGTGQVNVQATDGTITQSASLPFLLADYSISNVTTPTNLTAGGNATFNFKLTPSTGYAGAVVLSCGTVPSLSTSCSFTPASPITLTPGTTTQVSASLNVPADTANGNVALTLNSNDQAITTLVHSQATAGFMVSSQPDFTIDSGITRSATLKAGASFSTSLNVGSQGGFNSQIAFTVAGCPSLASCTVTPNPFTPTANGTSSVTLNITTKAPTLGSARPLTPEHNFLAVWLAGSFGVFGLVFLRNKRGSAGLLMLAFVMMIGMSACGGGGGGGSPAPPVPQPGTPAGTYTIVITGTSGTVVKTANFTLTVQ